MRFIKNIYCLCTFIISKKTLFVNSRKKADRLVCFLLAYFGFLVTVQMPSVRKAMAVLMLVLNGVPVG